MALRIALFGQAAFGRDVLVRLRDAGHAIAGVYAPPASGRPDPLAEEAEKHSLPLFRHKRFQRRGEASQAILEEHRSLSADLNVLAFVTAILPQELVDAPPHGSLCFHPSLLPRYRGGAALAWQIMRGERETGVTVFRPDAFVDTGPIVVQRDGVAISDNDTAATLYFEKLYPLGVEALVEAVAAVDRGTARYVPQDESCATFQGLVGDDDARIDWSRPAIELDRQLRGCDPQPGAFALWGDERLRLFDARLVPSGPGDPAPGSVVGLQEGRLLLAAHGGWLSVGRVRLGDGPKQAAGEAGLAVGERLD